jgi:CRP-like cAMP-binding protein
MRERYLDIRPWIRRLEGGGSLGPEQRRALKEVLSEPRRFGPDEALARPSDFVKYAILVLSGLVARVQLSAEGGRRISSILVPGDICSCGLALAQPIDYDLVALSRGECARITAADLRTLQATTPELMLPISRSLVEEALVGRAWLLNDTAPSGRARVAHLLAELHWRLSAVGLAGNDSCHIPMMQRDIAAAVGLSTVQVNRVLQQLRSLGAIALGRGGLAILDTATLWAVGEFEPNYLEVRLRPADDLIWRGIALH